jgi:MbtH protein
VSDPFDDPDGSYLVLRNEEEQYSLWPAFSDVPAGWHIVHGPGQRNEMIGHIEQNWVDMRPRSLRDAMNS